MKNILRRVMGAGLLVSTAAMAQPGVRHAPPERGWTRTEALTAASQAFDRADTNKDGVVTREEFWTAKQAMKAKHSRERDELRDEHRAKEMERHQKRMMREKMHERLEDGHGGWRGEGKPPRNELVPKQLPYKQ